MEVKKTTLSLDEESYYFLKKIALYKYENERKIFLKDYDTIYYLLQEIEILINENKINFQEEHLLKTIDSHTTMTFFITLNEQAINTLKIFKSKINNNNKINIKRNQMIKTMIILYFKLLFKCR